MRAIALAIILSASGIEHAITHKPLDIDTPEGKIESVFIGIFLVCLILGI